MANELNAPFVAGQTMYCVLQQQFGSNPGTFFRQDTSVLEAYNGARWTTAAYCVALAELTAGTSAGFYQASAPSSLPQGDYTVYVYQQLTVPGSPARTDQQITSFPLYWTGTAALALSRF